VCADIGPEGKLLSLASTVLEKNHIRGIASKNPPKIDLETEMELIKFAYEIAEKAHEHETRRSGEAYITHPVAVATIILTDFPKPTAVKVAVALMHDVVEDAHHK